MKAAKAIAWILLSTVLIGLPVVVATTFEAMKTCRNDIVEWAAPDSSAHRDFAEFRKHFGSNDIVFLSWNGCSVDDPKLDVTHNALEEGDRTNQFFRRVQSPRRSVDELQQHSRISESEVFVAMQGLLIGPDQSSARIAIELSSAGMANRPAAIAAIKTAGIESGVEESHLKLAGPGMQLYLIDRESIDSPMRVVPAILLLAFLLTWYHLGEMRLALVILATSVFAGFATTSLIHLTGTTLNAVIWTLPTLITLLTTSAALHLVNYHRSVAQESGLEHATVGCLRLGWKPTVASAVTTACGLASLMVSETLPIQQFGIFGAAGVLFGTAFVVGIVPVVASSKLIRSDQRIDLESQKMRAQTHRWQSLATVTIKYRLPIVAVSICLMGFLASQLSYLRTSVALDAFFERDSKPLIDELWMEENIGAAGTTEFLLTFDEPNPSKIIDRVRLLHRVAHRLEKVSNVTATYCAASFMNDSLVDSSNESFMTRLIANRRIQSLYPQFRTSGLLSENDGQEIWRISAFVARQTDEEATIVSSRVERTASEILHSEIQRAKMDSSVNLTVTGLLPLSRNVEAQFRGDLIRSYLTGFGSIFVVVLWILRNPVTGLFATIPNVFPAAIVLGWVSLQNVNLDVGSIMTASVALGIAVDDTLHFTLWFQRRIREGMLKHAAIADTLRHCGPAMVQTSTICGLGVLLYGFSWFLPTARFGTMLAGMMGAALFGDLVLLPALIATPIGTIMFPVRHQPLSTDSSPTTHTN